MQDRFFIDTNLLIYYISNDESRKEVVKDLLVSNANIIISSQVIAEFVAVTVKKQILSFDNSVKYAKEFLDIFYIGLIDSERLILLMRTCESLKKNSFSLSIHNSIYCMNYNCNT